MSRKHQIVFKASSVSDSLQCILNTKRTRIGNSSCCSILLTPTTEPTTTQVIEESSNDNGNFLSKFSNTELIIISASVGIILSLTSIVCVVLVNKKKKNKPLETVESLQSVSQDQPSYINNDNNQ